MVLRDDCIILLFCNNTGVDNSLICPTAQSVDDDISPNGIVSKNGIIRFAARAFRKLLSIYVFSYFPFGFAGRIWDRIVSVPDHCLSFYFTVTFFKSTDVNV